MKAILFKSNLERVNAYIANTHLKKVTHIEYRTFDEGMCEANFFVLPKGESKDELEAFVTLYNLQLHFYEEWNLADTASENAESSIALSMQAEIENYLFEALSPDEVHKEIDWIITAIRKLLFDKKLSEKKSKAPDRWGIYKNNEKISINSTLNDLGLNDIISGIALDLRWNSINIMYQTANDYVLFSWSTGA